MAISRGQLVKELEPGLNALFGLEYKNYANEHTQIFDQENSLNKLESFASINGPIFYKLPVNKNRIKIVRKKWILDEFTTNNKMKIKNFYGGQELNWKVL